MAYKTFAVSVLLAAICGSNAFTPATPMTRQNMATSLQMQSSDVSRFDFLKQAAGLSIATAFTTSFSAPAFAEDVINLPSGVSYSVTKAGDGPKPTVGELAAVRFKAICVPTGNVIDDLFDNPEPYYTRVGSGGLIKGIEEVIPKMVVGDRYFVTIPGKLAFGQKGRPSSAGKPRIPADATITFDIEMVGLPGRETELIELIGDD